MTQINAERLKSFVERIERLDEEVKAVQGDRRDVFAEAKGAGYDVKILRRLISERRMDSGEREERDAILTRYMHAMGMPTTASVSYTSIVEAPSDELTDKRTLRAIDMLSKSASIRDVVDATGMGHGSVQRLRKTLLSHGVPHFVPQDDGTIVDAATGEIIETDSPAGMPPNGVAATGPAAAEPLPAAPAGDADEPTVSVSVHHGGEVLADSGPLPMAALNALADFDPARDMPACLRRGKAAA